METHKLEIVRQLLALLGSNNPSEAEAEAEPKPVGVFVGRYAIVRCRDAGVHAGVVEYHSGREVTLREARRLWYWKVPAGAPAFLSGVAMFGITDESKIGCPVSIHLTESCEIIPCSEEAERSIRGKASHERSN